MANAPVTFEELRRSARKSLTEVGVDNADIDCKILLREAFGLDGAALIANAHHPVSGAKLIQFNAMLARRRDHEPIAYIIGRQPFWSLEFEVTPDVLVPRPETEGVVERALELLKEVENPSIIDIGTGSGAILLSLLQERKDATGIGLDVSANALAVAIRNAERCDMAERAKFVMSDYLAEVDDRVDLIVSNPPYITNQAMGELSETVAGFEPDLALRGGADGLLAYKAIIADLSRVLLPKGVVVFEVGYDQGKAVADLLNLNGFVDIRVDKDLANHDRVVSGKLSA